MSERHVPCQCGDITGEQCQWSGPISETVVVEYVPRDLRGTAEAAGSWAGLSAQARVESGTCLDVVTHIYDDEGDMTDEPDPWVLVAD